MGNNGQRNLGKSDIVRIEKKIFRYLLSYSGMLTRPWKSETEVEAEARYYEAEAKDVA